MTDKISIISNSLGLHRKEVDKKKYLGDIR